MSPMSLRKLPLVPASSVPNSRPPVPPRNFTDEIYTPTPVDDGYSRIGDILPAVARRRRSSLRLEDVTHFCKKHNLKIALRHSASDLNLLSPVSSAALQRVCQNETSVSRDRLSGDISSSKIAEKQKTASMDPLDVFEPDDQSLMHDTKQFHSMEKAESLLD